MLLYRMAKLKRIRLDEIEYTPKELSQYWRSYFAQFSVDVSRLFMKSTMQNSSVRFLHRDVFLLKDYLKQISQNSLIQPFRIKPHNEIGFVYLTGELCNHLIHFQLGGSEQKENSNVHYLTNFDEKLLSHSLTNLVALVETHLRSRDSSVLLEMLEPIHLNMMEVSFKGNDLISAQQFLLMTGSNTHVFDLGFSNKFLESFVLI